jgi:hypothetical protein
MTPLVDQGARLLSIADGWDGPDSRGCDKWTVLLSVLLLGVLIEQGHSTPYLSPTHDGGVRAEWPVETQAWNVSVDFAGDHVYVHALDLVTDEVDDGRFEWSQADEIEPMLGRLLIKPGAAASCGAPSPHEA